MLSVVTAFLAIATPLLAGQVVNAITTNGSTRGRRPAGGPDRRDRASPRPASGWSSGGCPSRIGETLILDLRRAVFDHVQTMPVAFFTRTRTGALVSRLNNDVIGAQRAFSDTLSGVVTNIVAVALALVAMLTISWPITVLALVLLPVFVLPARRMGARLARLRLEAANLNSLMSTQMTERFSAPGATLVKLFSSPERESVEFGERAPSGARHRRPLDDGPDGLRDRPDAGVGARPGPRLRARRLVRAAGHARGRRRS